MAYTKQNWVNGDPSTPLSAERLNHMEDGIASAVSSGSSVTTDVQTVREDDGSEINFLRDGNVLTVTGLITSRSKTFKIPWTLKGFEHFAIGSSNDDGSPIVLLLQADETSRDFYVMVYGETTPSRTMFTFTTVVEPV